MKNVWLIGLCIVILSLVVLGATVTDDTYFSASSTGTEVYVLGNITYDSYQGSNSFIYFENLTSTTSLVYCDGTLISDPITTPTTFNWSDGNCRLFGYDEFNISGYNYPIDVEVGSQITINSQKDNFCFDINAPNTTEDEDNVACLNKGESYNFSFDSLNYYREGPFDVLVGLTPIFKIAGFYYIPFENDSKLTNLSFTVKPKGEVITFPLEVCLAEYIPDTYLFSGGWGAGGSLSESLGFPCVYLGQLSNDLITETRFVSLRKSEVTLGPIADRFTENFIINVTSNSINSETEFRIPQGAEITNSSVTIRPNIGGLSDLGFPDEPYIVIEADSVDTAELSSSYCNVTNITISSSDEPTWVLSGIDADYEVRRSKMMNCLFNNPTSIQNPEHLYVTDERDVNKRMYRTRVFARLDDDGKTASYEFTYSFSNNYNDTTASIWYESNVGAGIYADSVQVQFPSGRSIVNVDLDDCDEGIPHDVDNYNTDASADEYDNPSTLRYTQSFFSNCEPGADGQVLSYRSNILTEESIEGEFTNIDSSDTYGEGFETTDFLNEYGIPRFEEWYYYYPEDLTVDIGIIDGTPELSLVGLNQSNHTITGFNNDIESYLESGDDCIGGLCYIKIHITSSKNTQLNITDLSIEYDGGINNVTFSEEDLAQYQRNFSYTSPDGSQSDMDSENIRLYFHFFKMQSSRYINISNINHKYKSYFDEYRIQNTNNNDIGLNVTYYSSTYNVSFPDNAPFLEFIPSTSKSKNVTPYGQTRSQSILTINSTDPFNSTFSMYINESDSCVNLSAANDYENYSVMGQNWTELGLIQPSLGVWMSADYNCNENNWRLWRPEIYTRACCVGCEICSEEIT